MSQHELNNDLPAYLVFLILGHIRELRKLEPDHILVRAVNDALRCREHDRVLPCEHCLVRRPQITEQLELLDVPAFLRHQAD